MSANKKTETVHITRSISPAELEVSPEIELKHKRSVELYPEINLTPGEYVIFSIKRHLIGLTSTITLGLILAIVGFLGLFNADLIIEQIKYIYPAASPLLIWLPSIFFIVASMIGIYVSYFVYTANRFYLTNESIIQIIQVSLFSRQEQIASLGSVEDCSFKQDNLIENMFNYGHIRLSTVGDETTYRFDFAPNPDRIVKELNNVVEAYKNGRAIPTNED